MVCPWQRSSRASVASPGIGIAFTRNPLRGGPEFVDICTTVIQSYLDAQLVFLAGRFPVASGVQTEAPELAFRFDVRSPDPYTITMAYRMGKPCGLVDRVRPVGGVHPLQLRGGMQRALLKGPSVIASHVKPANRRHWMVSVAPQLLINSL